MGDRRKANRCHGRRAHGRFGPTESTILCLSMLLLLVASHLCPGLSEAGEVYKWVDQTGTVHFTDDYLQVPEDQRPKVEVRRFRARTSTPPDPYQPANPPEGSPSQEPAASRQFTVPYTAYEGSANRIIISVTFNDEITAPVLLDTGAPSLVIFNELADRLGLFDKNDGKVFIEAGGIGGTVPAILTVVDTVNVQGAVAEFLPTTVTKRVSEAFDGILGMDFLANYEVHIDTRNHVVTFSEMPYDERRPAGHDENWWRSTFRLFSSLKDPWKEYLAELDKARTFNPGRRAVIKELKRIAQAQYDEATKLHRRLESFASRNAVPRHWRMSNP